MRWLRLVGSLKTYVSFAKVPYKRDYLLRKTPIFLRSLLIIATPYENKTYMKKKKEAYAGFGNYVRFFYRALFVKIRLF